MHEEFNEFDEFEDEDLEEFDDFEEKSPLEQWKQHKKEGGFYDYGQWLEENGYIKVERWEAVHGFGFRYEVSNTGKVRNIETKRILKQSLDSKGYKTVTLSRGGYGFQKRVNILVAEAFLGGPYPDLDVYHKDGDKTNNNVDNLKWCTRKENIRHAIKDGLMKPNNFGKKTIKVKCIENGKTYNSLNDCSRDIGVATSDIGRYLSGKVKTTCKGYTFERVE